MLLPLVAVLPMVLNTLAQTATETDTLHAFEQRAVKFNSVITLPQFETTSNAVRATVKQTIATGNTGLDRLAGTDPHKLTFDNTVRALDDVAYEISLVANRLSLIKETSTSAEVRDAATDAIKELQEWIVGLEYREDVYKVLKAYADTQPKLEGEDAKLLFETLRDYRRAGLALPKAQRDEVERMRKELARLATDFESNVTKAEKAVLFTRAELEGVPDSFLEQVKSGDDQYKGHGQCHLAAHHGHGQRQKRDRAQKTPG
jgi:Zn-dependent oligopeptidase